MKRIGEQACLLEILEEEVKKGLDIFTYCHVVQTNLKWRNIYKVSPSNISEKISSVQNAYLAP